MGSELASASPRVATVALFNALSPDVAQALALHMAALEERDRQRELRALRVCCRLSLRGEVLHVARERFRLTRPNWTPLLAHWSTSDVVVRLYLESRETFVLAQRSLLLSTAGSLQRLRGAYVAEAVPSHDRCARFEQVLVSLVKETSRQSRSAVRVCAGEHELGFFIGPRRLARRPETLRARDLARQRYQMGLVFHYESGAMLLKAERADQCAAMARAFAEIFARDPHYFAQPVSRLDGPRARDLHLLYKTYGSVYKTRRAYDETTWTASSQRIPDERRPPRGGLATSR